MMSSSCLFSKTLVFIHRYHSLDAALLLASSSYSTAAAAAAPQRHFMSKYLVSRCGFDPVKAAKALKLLGGIKSRHQPDAVLGFFKSNGFEDAKVKKLVSSYPKWFLLDVENTLAPKFRALQDLGFSPSDVAYLVQSNSAVITHKLHTVVPKIQFWQGLLGSNDVLVKLCKQHRWLLGYSLKKRIQPNIDMLRDCGITDPKLSTILRYHPGIITIKPDSLKALISRAEGLGVARTSGMFHWTLWALIIVSLEKFKAQLELFRGFGWSEADFLAAFRKAPIFVTGSLKSLQSKMEFLVNDAGCAPSYIALRPVILTLSLEKRLIPRFRILTALKSWGFPVGDPKLYSYMSYSEKKFLEKYIIRYKEQCPDLIELYNASLKTRTAL